MTHEERHQDRGSGIRDQESGIARSRIDGHKMRWSLLTALAIGGCASNTSTVVRNPGQLSAADTAAIVAAALNDFASPNRPIVAVSTRLSCAPQIVARCSGPLYVLESTAARSAIESFASRRGVRLITSYPDLVPCAWGPSTADEKGVALSVFVPHVRDNQVRVGVSISCTGNSRSPNEGFAEGITYHMEFVDRKWKVKAIISHVVT